MSDDQTQILIKTFEGLRLKAYRDSIGVLTIGYGHTGSDIKPNMQISIEQAESLLDEDIAEARSLIKQYITVALNENQLAALTSLVFNLGSAVLKGTLGKMLNNGDYAGASQQFPRWCHAGADILPGLVKRRAAEQKLFNTPTGD